MQIDTLLLSLNQFIRRHGIPDDLPSRKEKLIEEVRELIEAIDSKDTKNIKKEAADVAIVVFHIMMICGAPNPLWPMWRKILEVSKRAHYREIVEKVAQQTPRGL